MSALCSPDNPVSSTLLFGDDLTGSVWEIQDNRKVTAQVFPKPDGMNVGFRKKLWCRCVYKVVLFKSCFFPQIISNDTNPALPPLLAAPGVQAALWRVRL